VNNSVRTFTRLFTCPMTSVTLRSVVCYSCVCVGGSLSVLPLYCILTACLIRLLPQLSSRLLFCPGGGGSNVFIWKGLQAGGALSVTYFSKEFEFLQEQSSSPPQAVQTVLGQPHFHGGFFPEVKCQGVKLTTYLHLVPGLKKHGYIHPVSP
jgi:hypothetical protein